MKVCFREVEVQSNTINCMQKMGHTMLLGRAKTSELTIMSGIRLFTVADYVENKNKKITKMFFDVTFAALYVCLFKAISCLILQNSLQKYLSCH